MECIKKYKTALGIETAEKVDESKETTITIASIKYIDIDGNTYIYLIDADGNIFKAFLNRDFLADHLALTGATACERKTQHQDQAAA